MHERAQLGGRLSALSRSLHCLPQLFPQPVGVPGGAPEILPRICLQRCQPGTCVGDREINRPDCEAEFAPIERHGYGRARPCMRRIRCDGG